MKCDRCGETNPAEIHTCTPKQSGPVIQARKEGDLIVADLPQVPTGGGGISSTLPAKREWINLTATEIKILRRAANNDREFAELVQAKLKEKNRD